MKPEAMRQAMEKGRKIEDERTRLTRLALKQAIEA